MIRENIKEKIENLIDESYQNGYHDGRRAYRNKLVESGLISINPSKRDELLKICDNSPCLNCEYYNPNIKIGCNEDPQKCKRMQSFLIALEIKNYFDNNNE